MKRLCICGCGKEIIIKYYHRPSTLPKYIHGHNGKNLKGIKRSEETKRKISLSKKGLIPWNKGIKGKSLSEEHKKKISETQKTISHSGHFKKGNEPWNKGKTGYLSKEALEKISKSQIGNKNNFGKKRTEEFKKKMSEYGKANPPFKGKKHTEEVKEKMSKIMKGKNTSVSTQFKKGHKPSKDMIKKMLRRNKKSSLEIKFERIIKKYNLPYKFVGNGEVIIGNKCPDFINVNGLKIAIEIYCKKHKELFKNTTIQEWINERKEIFNNYGWDLLFFDENQINEKNILNHLGGGKIGESNNRGVG